jgi:hypothetical protein
LGNNAAPKGHYDARTINDGRLLYICIVTVTTRARHGGGRVIEGAPMRQLQSRIEDAVEQHKANQREDSAALRLEAEAASTGDVSAELVRRWAKSEAERLTTLAAALRTSESKSRLRQMELGWEIDWHRRQIKESANRSGQGSEQRLEELRAEQSRNAKEINQATREASLSVLNALAYERFTTEAASTSAAMALNRRRRRSESISVADYLATSVRWRLRYLTIRRAALVVLGLGVVMLAAISFMKS